MQHGILLLSCPDQRGITAAITSFISEYNGNIVDADQHADEETGTFFMRIEWSMEGFAVSRSDLQDALKPLLKRFDMDHQLHFTGDEIRVAVFVSKHMHCLWDLLYRSQCGRIKCTIPLIVSNHEDARELADKFEIDYLYTPVTRENKAQQEAVQIQAIRDSNVEVAVLARYHQILTSSFIDQYPQQIINIHHSFLPAFVGQNPYRQAFDRGVKIIGATSHFVTEELDEGPIISQDTVEVSHRDVPKTMRDRGEDLEKVVLGNALRLYCERRILVHGNKTIIFSG